MNKNPTGKKITKQKNMIRDCSRNTNPTGKKKVTKQKNMIRDCSRNTNPTGKKGYKTKEHDKRLFNE
jgi:hypothetical protein